MRRAEGAKALPAAAGGSCRREAWCEGEVGEKGAWGGGGRAEAPSCPPPWTPQTTPPPSGGASPPPQLHRLRTSPPPPPARHPLSSSAPQAAVPPAGTALPSSAPSRSRLPRPTSFVSFPPLPCVPLLSLFSSEAPLSSILSSLSSLPSLSLFSLCSLPSPLSSLSSPAPFLFPEAAFKSGQHLDAPSQIRRHFRLHTRPFRPPALLSEPHTPRRSHVERVGALHCRVPVRPLHLYVVEKTGFNAPGGEERGRFCRPWRALPRL